MIRHALGTLGPLDTVCKGGANAGACVSKCRKGKAHNTRVAAGHRSISLEACSSRFMLSQMDAPGSKSRTMPATLQTTLTLPSPNTHLPPTPHTRLLPSHTPASGFLPPPSSRPPNPSASRQPSTCAFFPPYTFMVIHALAVSNHELLEL